MFLFVLLYRSQRGKSGADEIISSTASRCYDVARPSFDVNIANKSAMTSSPFTEKTVSPFSLAAKPIAPSISPKKSPMSSSVAAAGISRTSSGISGTQNFPADRHVSAGSSFMKSDHISRLNFNSVSTTSVSGDVEPTIQWLGSFTEVQTPGGGFPFPPQPVGNFTSPTNSVDDEMSPPVLKPKIRRTSHRTPDKSPLVTSSSADAVEMIKPSIGLGQPPGFADSDVVDFDPRLSQTLPVSASAINSTSRRLSVSSNSLDEEPFSDLLPVSAKNTKQPSSAKSDSYSSAGSEHRNSHRISKPDSRDKAMPKSRSRSAKKKSKSSPAADDYEKQRSELNNAFEAACRLPSTVMGQPSLDKMSDGTNHWSAFDGQKVSHISVNFCCATDLLV